MQQQDMQPPRQQSSSGSSGTSDELRSDAKQMKSKAAERLHSEVDARKGEAASQAKSVSNAMQKAAGELDDSPDWLRSAFRQGAEQVQRFAQTLEQKDSRQIFNEVQNFARQRPAMFLGACAAAGFAASRVFRAGGEQQSGEQYGSSSQGGQSQSWSQGNSDFGSAQGQNKPFMAAGDSDNLGAGQRSASQSGGSTGDDPLILGTGGAGGSELSNRGDNR